MLPSLHGWCLWGVVTTTGFTDMIEHGMAALQVNDSVSTSFLVPVAVHITDLQGKHTVPSLPPHDAVHGQSMHNKMVAKSMS